MKEYKYTIDGKEYQVVIGEIVDNVANVTVNGEEYKVLISFTQVIYKYFSYLCISLINN